MILKRDQLMGFGAPAIVVGEAKAPAGRGTFTRASRKTRARPPRPTQAVRVSPTMQAFLDAITRVGAKRLVIDSLVGFEMALAPGFRADFRGSLYRMIGALTGAGITILSTVEVEDSFTLLQF